MARDRLPYAMPAGLPWLATGLEPFEVLSAQVPCDVLVSSIWSLPSPQSDEVILAHGVPVSQLSGWLRADFLDEDLNHRAIVEGKATRTAISRGPWSGLGHVLVLAVPQNQLEQRYWWMLLTRREKAFTVAEQDQAALTLRRWAVLFNRTEETGMGRMIVGQDDRLVAADLNMQQLLLDQPDALTKLLAQIKPVVQQWFPKLTTGEYRDFAVELSGKPLWVTVRQDALCTDEAARRWYLEVRPLEADELPVVGVLEDDRIAHAIAYLHDRFDESPSLAEIARSVHTSPFHFHRMFTKQVGMSPKQYLQRKQLQVARWMLRASRKPIGQIAIATGFASHGHFTSTFHRIVGVSPSQYRDNAQTGPVV